MFILGLGRGCGDGIFVRWWADPMIVLEEIMSESTQGCHSRPAPQDDNR